MRMRIFGRCLMSFQSSAAAAPTPTSGFAPLRGPLARLPFTCLVEMVRAEVAAGDAVVGCDEHWVLGEAGVGNGGVWSSRPRMAAPGVDRQC